MCFYSFAIMLGGSAIHPRKPYLPRIVLFFTNTPSQSAAISSHLLVQMALNRPSLFGQTVGQTIGKLNCSEITPATIQGFLLKRFAERRLYR